MTEFLTALFGFPTAIYTALLGISVIYWLFVLIGAVDVDLFGGGAEGALEGATDGALEGVADGAIEGAVHGVADGALEGAAHGIADGALEGVADGAIEGAVHGVADGALEGAAHGIADGALEGVADGAIEGAAHGAAEGVADGVADGIAEGVADGVAEGHGEALVPHGHEGALAYVLSSLRLRNAPVTVVFSLFALTGWAYSMIGSLSLQPTLGVLIPSWIIGGGLLALTFPLALITTSYAIKPLAPLFVHETSHGHHHLVGKTCFVSTGRVDQKFGQARIEETGNNLLVQVRSTEETSDLKKNDEALIVDYDPVRDVYVVEPYRALLGEGEVRRS